MVRDIEGLQLQFLELLVQEHGCYLDLVALNFTDYLLRDEDVLYLLSRWRKQLLAFVYAILVEIFVGIDEKQGVVGWHDMSSAYSLQIAQRPRRGAAASASE